MKIAFDISPLQSGHKSRGMGFYTRNLLDGLKSVKSIQIQEFTDINQVRNADIVHYPYFDLFQSSLPLIKKYSTIVTIGDVTPLVFPQHYPSGLKGRIKLEYQKLALKNVHGVITFSECSKKDINSYLRFNEKLIFPIYLAAAPHFHVIIDKKILEEVEKKYNLPKEFALYVGSVNWNKNIVNLTQAALDAEVEVVLVGRSFEDRQNLDHPELKSYKEFLQKFDGNPKVHIKGFLSNEDLVSVYNLAKVVLLPSFYEGFGLPILEAQTCGTPVITSSVSSMPEVAGDGALLVDPYKVTEITFAIKDAVYDKDIRNEVIKKGVLNAQKFSWCKTVVETVKAYEYVSNQKA